MIGGGGLIFLVGVEEEVVGVFGRKKSVRTLC